jgi:hypothetical protein
MNSNLIIILVIIALIFFGASLFRAISKIKLPSANGNNNNAIISAVISFVAYGLLVGLVYLKIPSLWESWTSPFSFFIITNLALISGVLLLNVVKTKIGWVVIIITALFILIPWFGVGVSQIPDLFKKNPPKIEAPSSSTISTKTSSGSNVFLFTDSPDGRITKYINFKRGGKIKPLGGKIKISTPSGKILDDGPNEFHVRPKFKSGTYTFWADPDYPGANGVEIIEN